MVRGTTNVAGCCHLANDTDLLTPFLWAMAGDNKQIDLWPADPFIRIDSNVIRSFHGHSTPSLKISCKSVQPFSRTVADKETKKERKKEITRKQYPGRGNNAALALRASRGNYIVHYRVLSYVRVSFTCHVNRLISCMQRPQTTLQSCCCLTWFAVGN